MENFKYKEYTAEEDKIYNEAMVKIIEGVKNGLNFDEACSNANVDDEKLREFIMDDALKVMIAEMHYIKGLSLYEVASALKVSMETVNKANLEMLEDIGIASAEFYKQNNPDRPVGNA